MTPEKKEITSYEPANIRNPSFSPLKKHSDVNRNGIVRLD